MIDGKKVDIPKEQTINSSRSAFGILLIGLIVAFGIHIIKNYDEQNRSLQFFGTVLQLGD